MYLGWGNAAADVHSVPAVTCACLPVSLSCWTLHALHALHAVEYCRIMAGVRSPPLLGKNKTKSVLSNGSESVEVDAVGNKSNPKHTERG